MDNFVCKFAQVLRLYTHQGKIYKHFFTGKLVYFWKKNMISTLEMFLRSLNTVKVNLSNFKQSAIATQNSSCIISLILVNQIENLTVSHSPPLRVKLVWTSVSNGNVSVVKSVLSQLSCNARLYIIFYHLRYVPGHSITKAIKSPTSTSGLTEHVIYSSWFF